MKATRRKSAQYTTEPFFLTELVDHLPASDTVPTPEKVLGYAIGTPDKLTYTKDIYRYMRELEKASPRVKVFVIGQSEEGRETLLVAVSDEANIAEAGPLQRHHRRLADPRKTSEAEAKQLIDEGLPLYWASGSIHSPETGSPEMLMELAYRLAVEDSPLIQNIRKNMIVLITPASEVDGRDREVDVYNYHKANPEQARCRAWCTGASTSRTTTTATACDGAAAEQDHDGDLSRIASARCCTICTNRCRSSTRRPAWARTTRGSIRSWSTSGRRWPTSKSRR